MRGRNPSRSDGVHEFIECVAESVSLGRVGGDVVVAEASTTVDRNVLIPRIGRSGTQRTPSLDRSPVQSPLPDPTRQQSPGHSSDL